MDIILKIIRIIEIFSFIFANFVAFLIFRQFFPTIGLVEFFSLFLISLLILKNSWIFFIIDILKEKWRLRKEKQKNEHHLWKKVSKAKGFFIFFKLLFFNVLYDLFPIYLVWIGTSVFIYLFANMLGLSIFSPPNDSIYTVTATFGILLGVFQYYMQRHEEKILTKINIFSKIISNIIHQETSFDDFYDSIPDNDDGRILKNWMLSQIDPKLQFRDVLAALSKDKDAIKSIKHLMRRQKIVPFNVNISYQESNTKFKIIESTVKMAKKEKLLETAYINFFDNQTKVDKIISEIEEEIDIQEYGRLLLSNINIVYEVLPQLISRPLRQNMKSIVVDHPNVESSRILNSRKYREILDKKVMDELISQILK